MVELYGWLRKHPRHFNVVAGCCFVWVLYSICFVFPQGIWLVLEIVSTMFCGLFLGWWVAWRFDSK